MQDRSKERKRDSYVMKEAFYVMKRLNAKLTSVNDILRGIDQIKCELCALPDDVDLKDALVLTIELEEDAQEMKVRLLAYLSKYENESETVCTIPKANIKIPDLSFLTFSEKFQEFVLFKSQFIGNNPSLDETQKLIYLKSSLKNEAVLIQSDQDTFDSLLNALESRIEYKRALVIRISEILSINKLHNENPTQIRSLIDAVRNHIQSLKNLQFESNP
ncbi:hypothetical protein HNY73_023170 [Argiope bruennichi]|uniref:Uncharacterized protein n=1 Tax=Argiope bruennichi TaxID=94029 RepID=A0A8T0E3A1_ARGBR|nr:hypothetical protein HNY73_023170 [Argiope bruennichi]